ncbi:MAG: rod shape-determining protein MreC [Bacteriovoracales bacterium]|nr:rod shape-determining protein MreC [Bacteriovoracales bacterium]
MLANFLERENRLKVIVFVLVSSISLFDAMKKGPPKQTSSLFERTMIDLLGPLQNSIFEIKYGLSNFVHHYLNLVEVKKDNGMLAREISRLKNQIFQFEELRKENRRLKELFGLGKGLEHEKILAQVIGWDTGRNVKLIRVNRGKDSGIENDLPVVAVDGLVGRVHRVSDSFSDIMTVLDQRNRVDGIITKTRSHGIIEGHYEGKCIMKYVTRSKQVVLDDEIITSGLGRIYPKGLQIGKISKIERESYGITQFIELTPSVDFGKLEEVIILKPKERSHRPAQRKHATGAVP